MNKTTVIFAGGSLLGAIFFFKSSPFLSMVFLIFLVGTLYSAGKLG